MTTYRILYRGALLGLAAVTPAGTVRVPAALEKQLAAAGGAAAVASLTQQMRILWAEDRHGNLTFHDRAGAIESV